MLLRPPAPRSGPRPAPVVFSLAVHLTLLASVAFGPRVARRESLYQREIAPQEKKLVWYRFRDKLPDVSPAEKERAAGPLHAEEKNPDQTIISKSPQADRAKQMTIAPAPEVKIQPELAAPNLMAFAQPKAQPKLFAPPAPAPTPVEQPRLENAPALSAANRNLPLATPLPQAPKLTPKAFTPPEQIARRVETPRLEPGEFRIVAKAPDLAPISRYPVPVRPQPKAFAPPPAQQTKPVEAPAALSDAPAVRAQSLGVTGIQTAVAAPSRPQPKTFLPPAASAAPSGAATAIETAPEITVAVVGLNPVDRLTPVLPEVSRPAQFSAAPEVAATPGPPSAPASSTGAVAPGLTIRNGPVKRESIATLARVAPTSRENLMAAVRPVLASASIAPPPLSSAAMRSSGRDPRFGGRIVYTVALQMPNVTSSSGSWILWYADRAQEGSDTHEILAPVPLRKVDPIYDLSAAADRIEGKVQLSAVIHSDGYVYNINVVSGIDPRLDQNAVAALRKWEFQPASREGAPVDVDVVIEIPFRLRTLK